MLPCKLSRNKMVPCVPCAFTKQRPRPCPHIFCWLTRPMLVKFKVKLCLVILSKWSKSNDYQEQMHVFHMPRPLHFSELAFPFGPLKQLWAEITLISLDNSCLYRQDHSCSPIAFIISTDHNRLIKSGSFCSFYCSLKIVTLYNTVKKKERRENRCIESCTKII